MNSRIWIRVSRLIAVMTLVSLFAISACGSSPVNVLLSGSRNILPSGPLQVLIEGDSIALTLAIGMSGSQEQFGVHILDNGQLGCGIAQGNPVMLNGLPDTLPANCDTWKSTWQQDVATDRPDVVGILVGRWEVTDRMHDGQWMHIGEPAYNSYLMGQLDSAVRIAGSRGARVVLFTTPYMNPEYDANGNQYPETLSARIDEWNTMQRQVAAKYPGEVSIIDLNKLLDPGGKYTSEVDGIQTRVPPSQDGDWDHISIPGGELLGPTILPELAKLGDLARTNG